MVTVRPDDVDRIDEVVAAHHQQFTPDELVRLQAKCRRLWVDQLSRGGFAQNLDRYLT